MYNNFGADLRGADMKNAVVSEEQLTKAKVLDGAILPDGTEYVLEN